MIIPFVGLNKHKAVRKALSYWYKNLKDNCTVLEFLSKCTYKKVENDFVVIYRSKCRNN